MLDGHVRLDRVRQARAPLVEPDHPAEPGQAVQEASQEGLLPGQIEVRHESRLEHQVDRTRADHLVRDAHAITRGVQDPWPHAPASDCCEPQSGSLAGSLAPRRSIWKPIDEHIHDRIGHLPASGARRDIKRLADAALTIDRALEHVGQTQTAQARHRYHPTC
jgi:hypothetical protein